MVYTGYEHYVRQQADETGEFAFSLTALFSGKFHKNYWTDCVVSRAEWLPYGESTNWDQSMAVYSDAGQMADEAQQLGPSLNTKLSLIDYELGMKHLLQHTWTVWHWENDRSKAWSDMLVDVTSFNTVEDFFRSVK